MRAALPDAQIRKPSSGNPSADPLLLPSTAMLVRLTKKLADVVNDIDLTHCNEGDVIDVPPRHALLLIAEGWAEAVAQDERTNCTPVWRPNAREIAADPERRDESLPGKLRQYLSIPNPATE